MTSIKGVPATDVLPEYFPYRDDGCEVSSSCLRCPLLRCRYDDPGGFKRRRRASRDRQVVRARRNREATVVELARRFRISERTVHRILARSRNGHTGIRAYGRKGHSAEEASVHGSTSSPRTDRKMENGQTTEAYEVMQ